MGGNGIATVVVWNIFAPFLLIGTLAGNTLALLVFSRKTLRRRRGTIYLVVLTLVDTIALITGPVLSEWLLRAFGQVSTFRPECNAFQNYLNYLMRAMTSYILAALTLERVGAVWMPMDSIQRCSRKVAYITILLLLVILGLAFSHKMVSIDSHCPQIARTPCSLERYANSKRTRALPEWDETLHQGGTLKAGKLKPSFMLNMTSVSRWRNVGVVKQWVDKQTSYSHLPPLLFHGGEGRTVAEIRHFEPGIQTETVVINNSAVFKLHQAHSDKLLCVNNCLTQNNPSFRDRVAIDSVPHGDFVFVDSSIQTKIARTARKRSLKNETELDIGRKNTGEDRDWYLSNVTGDKQTAKPGNDAADTGNRRENVSVQAAKQCTYLIFLRKTWPTIDLLISVFIPFLVILVGDLAVAYKVLFKTHWIFQAPSADGRRKTLISGMGRRRASSLTQLTTLLNLGHILTTTSLAVVIRLQNNEELKHDRDGENEEQNLILSIALILVYIRGAVDFLLFLRLGPHFRQEFKELILEIRYLFCQEQLLRGAKVTDREEEVIVEKTTSLVPVSANLQTSAMFSAILNFRLRSTDSRITARTGSVQSEYVNNKEKVRKPVSLTSISSAEDNPLHTLSAVRKCIDWEDSPDDSQARISQQHPAEISHSSEFKLPNRETLPPILEVTSTSVSSSPTSRATSSRIFPLRN